MRFRRLLTTFLVSLSVLTSVSAPALAAPGRPAVSSHSAELVQPGSGAKAMTKRLPANPYLSYAWTGYVASSSSQFVAAETNYKQPAVICPTPNATVLFWVGLDGFYSDSTTVEQAGTAAQCDAAGHVSYYAWTAMYPTQGIVPQMTVQAGDSINASVVYSPSSSNYILTVNDNKTSQSISQTTPCSSYYVCARSSAEWIVERPYSGSGYTPLADWQSIKFRSNKAAIQAKPSGNPDWQGFNQFSNTPINMVDKPYTGRTIAGISKVNSSSFWTDWQATQ